MYATESLIPYSRMLLTPLTIRLKKSKFRKNKSSLALRKIRKQLLKR